MRTAIKQLESLNYMRIVRDRSASGQFIQSRWFVSDEPIVDWAPHLENPRVEEPVLDHPVQGDQGATNTVFVERLDSSKTTTTGPEDSPPDTDQSPALIMDEADEECWLWLCQKLSLEPQKTRDQCAGLPHLQPLMFWQKSSNASAKTASGRLSPIPCLPAAKGSRGQVQLVGWFRAATGPSPNHQAATRRGSRS